MTISRQVPGVYYEPQPRTPPAPVVRTDVAGFIGFEPRVRDGSTPSTLTGAPSPVGHDFNVDISAFQVVVGNRRLQVPATADLDLSHDATSIPMAPGGSISIAILIAATAGGQAQIVVLKGDTATIPDAAGPSDDAAAAAVASALGAARPFVRLADVVFNRSAAGDVVRIVIVPTLPPTQCNDWRDYLYYFGAPSDDGMMLAPAVKAFFANGGSRCWIVTVRRPRFEDADGLTRALADMIGVQGSGEREATGLERLLLISEVSFIDVPDLYARKVAIVTETKRLPPLATQARFRRCTDIRFVNVAVETMGDRQPLDPLFDGDTQVLPAQQAMLLRCIPERWRVLLLLTAPLDYNPSDGQFHGPTANRAEAWRARFNGLADDREMACAAMYFPWVLFQDVVGGPVTELPPTAFVAGVIARRDLARGPHIAPANETLSGVVGLSRPVDDATNGHLYDAPLHLNCLRAFPGFGVQVWGARTLSNDQWLGQINVRRCLSSVERRAAIALEQLVFEPNTPVLWLQIQQLMFGALLSVWETGALRGSQPAEAFYVRCDRSLNTAAQIQNGILICQVGVAVAAPAEFLVFRVGRREGVIEVAE